jgi:hypothetical protein
LPVALRRLLRRFQSRWGSALQSDTAFIESAFREILGRQPDLDGLTHYRRVLRDGLGRTAVLLDLMRSEEFTSKLRAKLPEAAARLPSLRALRPESYDERVNRTNGETIPVFVAGSPADFDWLEDAIIRHGYYENPGVWNLAVDADKRVIAEIVASFRPERPLELGCAAGAVLECLDELGIRGEGIEISVVARDKAAPSVRDRIHQGDLLTLDLSAEHDVLFGLDVFEHLNPNRLGDYLARIAAVTTQDAKLFCNIPAFGRDPIFGTVFPFYLDEWDAEATAGLPFTTIEVDALGYPIHGHLTWADARWWTLQFERAGFARMLDVERTLHRKYDEYFDKRAPARKSFFVFAKTASRR